MSDPPIPPWSSPPPPSHFPPSALQLYGSLSCKQPTLTPALAFASAGSFPADLPYYLRSGHSIVVPLCWTADTLHALQTHAHTHKHTHTHTLIMGLWVSGVWSVSGRWGRGNATGAGVVASSCECFFHCSNNYTHAHTHSTLLIATSNVNKDNQTGKAHLFPAPQHMHICAAWGTFINLSRRRLWVQCEY